MLYHKKFRKTTVTTSFGDIEIDEKGFSNSLEEEQEKILGNLPNWEIVSNKVDAKDLKKEEIKEEVKETKEEVIETKEEEIETKEEEIELDENTIILGYTREELEAMNVENLKEILDDNKVKYPANIKKAKLIDKILEIQ